MGVIGNDQHVVVLTEVFQRCASHIQVVVAASTNRGEVGIVVIDVRAALTELFNDSERRRLAQVIDVLLVGQAEHENAGTIESFLVLVQCGDDRLDDELGHGFVYLPGQLDEASMKIPLLRFPTQVKGINGNAMATQSRPWIERLETEGL